MLRSHDYNEDINFNNNQQGHVQTICDTIEDVEDSDCQLLELSY